MNQENLTTLELTNILAEVSNENTLPLRLQEIYSNYNYPEIKSTLTSNPNTPLEILLKLGQDYPAQLLENPVFDLYLLSQPNLLAEMSENTLISILKLPQVPQEFILFALNNRRTPELLIAILINHCEKWRLVWDIVNNPTVGRNLEGAKLEGADLGGADLGGANLRSANLRSANLRSANLQAANLQAANLQAANLQAANLTGIKIDDSMQIDAKWLKQI
jgi:hypothetical protein